jgi:hypothetical protein
MVRLSQRSFNNDDLDSREDQRNNAKVIEKTPKKQDVIDLLNSENAEYALKMIGFETERKREQPCMVNMSLASEKVTIFETLKGPHDLRFVKFNDTPETCSKFKKPTVLVDTDHSQGRDMPIDFPYNDPVKTEGPSYDPNYHNYMKRLDQGYVEMSKQKPR